MGYPFLGGILFYLGYIIWGHDPYFGKSLYEVGFIFLVSSNIYAHQYLQGTIYTLVSISHINPVSCTLDPLCTLGFGDPL